MSRSDDGQRRGIPLLGWCAIGCGGCLVVAIVGGVVAGFFIRNLARNAMQAVPVATATPAGAGPLRQVWTYRARGTTDVAAADPSGTGRASVLVLQRQADQGARVAILDAAGHGKRSFKVTGEVSQIIAGRRARGLLILGFGKMSLGRLERVGSQVQAFDETGRSLWTYALGDLVDSACLVDLHLKSGDAVAVGFNGQGGVHLLNPDSSERWSAKGTGNAWRVASAHLAKGAPASLIAANMVGPMVVFDATGRKTSTLMPRSGVDQMMVSALIAADLDGNGSDEILETGRSMLGGVASLVVFDGAGVRRWTYTIGRSSMSHESRIAVGRFASGGPQIAVSAEDGTITLLSAGGKVLGKQALGARIVGLCTLPGGARQPDRLIAATTDGCACYAWRATGR